MSDYCDVFIPDRIREQLDPSLDFAAKLIRGADLSDPRYLYRFGEYITENELGVSRFLAGLSQSEIGRHGVHLYRRLSDGLRGGRYRSE